MAMGLSLAALGGVDVWMCGAECISKTFPGYFDAFRSICIRN
jgi:5-enolpyruvylshikimate-3-phosphate synthase